MHRSNHFKADVYSEVLFPSDFEIICESFVKYFHLHACQRFPLGCLPSCVSYNIIGLKSQNENHESFPHMKSVYRSYFSCIAFHDNLVFMIQFPSSEEDARKVSSQKWKISLHSSRIFISINKQARYAKSS